LFLSLGWIRILKILKSPVMKGWGRGGGRGWEGFNFQNMPGERGIQVFGKKDPTGIYIKISGMKPG
jgi:hypothetical protein